MTPKTKSSKGRGIGRVKEVKAWAAVYACKVRNHKPGDFVLDAWGSPYVTGRKSHVATGGGCMAVRVTISVKS